MKRWLLIALIILWLATVGAGMAILFKYETKPGVAAAAVQWPAESKLTRAADCATLLIFAHPHCPCTRATISELAKLMAHCDGKLRAQVLFVKPDGVAADWEQTDIWRSAAAIPGVSVKVDVAGSEARWFKAATSGQTFLFDAAGQLLFQGGITAARGHEGDNAGKLAVIAMVQGDEAETHTTPVFGCALLDAVSIEENPAVLPLAR